MTDPADSLVVPQPTAVIPPIADFVLHWPDLLSPSAWLLWVIEQVSGVNPLDWVTEHFSGDWEKMSVAANALRALADFHAAYAAELTEAKDRMLEGWSGNAAQGASTYLTELSGGVAAQVSGLRGAASDIDAVAYGMNATQDALGAVIGELLDWALIAAAAAAAAAASSWTIIGGILGGASTALAVHRAGNAWLSALEIHARTVAAVDALTGLITGYLGAVEGFAAHPLPAGGYDNPLVDR